MTTEKLEVFLKEVKNKNYKKARKIARDLTREKSDVPEDIEEISELNKDLVNELRMRGYGKISKIANASLQDLVKIPKLSDGRAKNVLDSARGKLVDKLTALPNVGEETAKEMMAEGYTTMSDLARADPKDLTDIEGVGKRGAEKIIDAAEDLALTSLGELPGVGKGTAEKMREEGVTTLKYIAESTPEELNEVPNVGKKGAEKIVEFARENPDKSVEDLPGVGEETAEEIRKHGYTPMHFIAEMSPKELSKIPNIGKKGAKEIIEFVRERTGGKLDELEDVDEETVESLRSYGFQSVSDVASSSLEELIRIPELREGKAYEVKQSAQSILRRSGGDVDGYKRGLKGVIRAVKKGNSLSLPCQILEKNYSEERLQKIQKEIRTKTNQVFRPANEKGYFQAWNDLIEAILNSDVVELEEENN